MLQDRQISIESPSCVFSFCVLFLFSLNTVLSQTMDTINVLRICEKRVVSGWDVERDDGNGKEGKRKENSWHLSIWSTGANKRVVLALTGSATACSRKSSVDKDRWS